MTGDNGSKVAAGPVRIQTDGDTIQPVPSDGFVTTPHVQQITERALAYLEVGYPVHFAGPAGTGKTTLAFHVASKIGRPVTLIHGDEEFATSDLIGGDTGYRKTKVVDNFIHSVLKTEEDMKTMWADNRLTTACKNGDTLIYDEFTRSRPEANNALLSVLAERILNLPKLRQSGEGYIEVHPQFRAIFTSNPEEYAGTHKTQDALMDRLISIRLDHYDRDTEVQIMIGKSGLPMPDAETIVDIVRELRVTGVDNHRPSIRASIAIARVLAHRHGRARPDDPTFQWLIRDVLTMGAAKVTRAGEPHVQEKLDEVIRRVCGSGQRARRRSATEGRTAPRE